MRILVTGSSGMIGSRLISRFSERHEFVTLGRRPFTQGVGSIRHVFHDFSIQGESLNLAGEGRFDAIVHLAQARAFRDFPRTITETFHVNSSSTLALLEYARTTGVETFVLASTGGLYEPHGDPLNEASRLKSPTFLDPYFASKLTAEAMCGSYSSLFRIVVPRFFFPFGHDQDPGQLFPRLIASVNEGRPIRIGGPSGLAFNPIPAGSAADAVEAILCANASGPVNVAGAEIVDLRTFVGFISSAIGKPAVFETSGDPDRLVADISLLKSFWSGPSMPLEHAVHDALVVNRGLG